MIRIHYCQYNDLYNLKQISLKEGTTIEDFSKHILKLEGDIHIGVYGKLKDKGYIIQNNDRIEIYEAIIADPKIKRKRKAYDN
jgi:putative ubiquitin-RnfH superfamily antitoxin RatB of RatAB toxin-antitoxin module